MTRNTVLIIDDEQDIRDLISDILVDEGFRCSTAADSDTALKIISEKPPTIVLLDIWLQGSNLDGLGVLEILKSKYPHIPVIMISGHGTIETAVNSIKIGAYDYIEKPFNSSKLAIIIKRACEAIKLKRENTELKKKLAKKVELNGKSEAIIKLKSLIEKIAPTSSRVLIKGDVGSGRELIAKIIHRKSNRSNCSFIKLNSSILQNEKTQKEIFSNREGEFGLIDLANKGTLFINEVCNLSLFVQHKILTLIKQQEEAEDKDDSNYDIRIIVSSSKDLKKEVRAGSFLQDLYYRLSSVSIELPTLNKRKEDIPTLFKYFMEFFEKTTNLSVKKVQPKVFDILSNYDWPGNVRQLKNLVEWLMIFAEINGSPSIGVEMLPEYILNKKASINMFDNEDIDIMSLPLRRARESFEKKYLSAQMAKFNNNISKTSLFVGMERSALHRKLKLLDIHHNDHKITTVDKHQIEQVHEEA